MTLQTDMPTSIGQRVDQLERRMLDGFAETDARFSDHERKMRAVVKAALEEAASESEQRVKDAAALAVKDAMAAHEERIVARLDALAARRQVPAWIETLTAARVGLVLSLVSGTVGVLLPATLAVIAALQGHPATVQVPLPLPVGP